MKEGVWLTLLALLVIVAVVVVRPDWICTIFGLTASESFATGAHALRVYCISVAFCAASILVEGFEQARDREQRAALLSVLRKGVVLFPCILLCAQGGENTIWWFFPATEMLSLVLYSLIQLWQASRKKDAATPEEEVYRGVIGSNIEELPDIMAEIDTFCENKGCTMRQQMVVDLVAEEVCSAIVRDGFKGKKDGFIQLTLFACEDGQFEFHIRDNAARFNPFELQASRMKSAEEEMDISAMGIQMIRKKVKSFFYRQYQGFNSLVIRV